MKRKVGVVEYQDRYWMPEQWQVAYSWVVDFVGKEEAHHLAIVCAKHKWDYKQVLEKPTDRESMVLMGEMFRIKPSKNHQEEVKYAFKAKEVSA
jgi:hypothetical protein